MLPLVRQEVIQFKVTSVMMLLSLSVTQPCVRLMDTGMQRGQMDIV